LPDELLDTPGEMMNAAPNIVHDNRACRAARLSGMETILLPRSLDSEICYASRDPLEFNGIGLSWVPGCERHAAGIIAQYGRIDPVCLRIKSRMLCNRVLTGSSDYAA